VDTLLAQRSGDTPINKEMIMKRCLLALPALLIAGAFATPSTAMPAGKSSTVVSAVQDVGYRKCAWRHGHRHCRYVDDGPSVSIQIGRDRHRHHRHNRYGDRRDHRGGGAEIRIR
jgi:hypothetical protein